MKNIKIFLFLLVTIFTLSACGSANVVNYDGSLDNMQADLYVAKNSGFKIDFPGEPKVLNEAVPTEGGDVNVTYYVSEKEGDGVAYMVTYSKYPQELFDTLDKTNLLENGLKGGLSLWNIQAPVEAQDITIDGYKGLYYRADNGQNFVIANLYLVDNALYQVVVISEKAYVPDNLVNKFMSSFALLR